MQSILLVGPVKGKQAYNALKKCQQALEAQGCEVVNPWQVANDLGPMLESHFNKELVKVMMEVDLVVTVDGWHTDKLSHKLIEVAKIFNIEYQFARRFVIDGAVQKFPKPRAGFFKRMAQAFDDRFGWFFTNGRKQTI